MKITAAIQHLVKVLTQRSTTHGDAKEQWATACKMLSAYFDRPITYRDYTNIMRIIKISRDKHGAYNIDDDLDISGYSLINIELNTEDKEIEL